MGQAQSLPDAGFHILYMLRCGQINSIRKACTSKPCPATALDCKFALLKLLQLYMCGAFQHTSTSPLDLSSLTLEQLLDKVDSEGPAFFGVMQRDRNIVSEAREFAHECLDALTDRRVQSMTPAELLVLEGNVRTHLHNLVGEKTFSHEFLEFASRLATTYRAQSPEWHLLQ